MATSTHSTTAHIIAALTDLINAAWGTPAQADICELVEAIIDLISTGNFQSPINCA